MKKEKIIRVRITADVAEKLQQVGNVSAYIRSALIANVWCGFKALILN